MPSLLARFRAQNPKCIVATGEPRAARIYFDADTLLSHPHSEWDPRAFIRLFFQHQRPAPFWPYERRIEIDRITVNGVVYIGGRLWPSL